MRGVHSFVRAQPAATLLTPRPPACRRPYCHAHPLHWRKLMAWWCSWQQRRLPLCCVAWTRMCTPSQR